MTTTFASICLSLLLVKLGSCIDASGGRPVLPLIPIGGTFSGPRHGGATGGETGAGTAGSAGGDTGAAAGAGNGAGAGAGNGAGAAGPAGGATGGGERAGGQFVSTSGTKVSCANNVDCYGLREPNEWCPLPAGVSYQDKGCWCDRSVGQCVIDRGDQVWAYCSDKATSRC